jgi:hypothetical protein
MTTIINGVFLIRPLEFKEFLFCYHFLVFFRPTSKVLEEIHSMEKSFTMRIEMELKTIMKKLLTFISENLSKLELLLDYG